MSSNGTQKPFDHDVLHPSQFINLYTCVIITAAQFASFFKRPGGGGRSQIGASVAKRAKGGHEKTPMGICLLCFTSGMKKFWLARGNPSSLSKHLQDRHRNERTKPTDAVPEDSPAAAEAMKAYRKLTSG